MNEIAIKSESASLLEIISRAASDPNIQIEKMERLLEMHERILARNAKASFDAALAEMQPELPTITEYGEVKVKDEVRSTYALFEDINEGCRPVLHKHGFAITFRVLTLKDEITVTAVLSHREGHREETSMLLPPDNSGSKNRVQEIASSVQYGKRYTMCALLNITSRGEDDDGNKTGTTDGNRRATNFHSPRPDGWKLQDTLKVTEYRDRILKCFQDGADLNALDVWSEIKSDEMFGTAVWQALPNPIKNAIRKMAADIVK